MTVAPEHHGLSLPGYTLSTRLGAGGYGEVWLAHAPGGLTKAVKFIYGSFHDKRAEHELRALEKVKEVRHPFLLSLERIEVIEGRLVIVTELAESSLKDRFDECRREGLPGIPRAELLKYLHDAADALDFLSEKHSLQHLDVKPENLLLVAGHVKVADFGLVKDIGKSQASLVGGLTPLYSAPEVFQGAPSSHSDQYSLAVLYQELLTGSLPFSGSSAAELTLQHLHEEPDLSVLPTADRYVLARALSKDPLQRFSRSTELIQALLDARGADAQSWAIPAAGGAGAAFDGERRAAATAETRRPGPITEFFDEQVAPPRKEVTTSMLLDWTPEKTSPPQALGPLELSTEAFCPSPTLVIGVGGVAGAVLKQLRLRIAKQFGDEPAPAVQMLLLDSDPKNIARAMQGDARVALKSDETLALPLRRPQDYREQSARLMRWLSRRWLYNIPRSLRTEGLRPLGRLAFADHARQAVQRIRMSLARATDPESIRTSREQTGLDFRGDSARVFVVASISGGAGSGMSLDVGYAVRTAVEKAGLTDAKIIGVFLHSTGSDPRRCDLAKVNAYAWLTEYNYFHRSGGQFPGDESCGLPPVAHGRAFDSAYLVDLGAELDDALWEQSAQSVAEYLFLDALTPAQSFFDECRRAPGEVKDGAAPLRTFAVHKIPAASEDSVEKAAATLSREVVLRWAGGDERSSSAATPAGAPDSPLGPSVRDTNQVVQGVSKLVSQLQLQLEGLASNARGLIETQFGGDQQAFITALLQPGGPQTKPKPAGEMRQTIDKLFALPPEQESGAFVQQRPLDAIVSPLTMKLAGDLARWVLRRLDDRQERLAGAQRGVQWLVDHLQRLDDDATRLSEGLARQIAAGAEELCRDNRGVHSVEEDWKRAVAYFRMRTDQHAVRASSLIARRLLTELKSVGATVAEFGRHLKHVAHSLPPGIEPSSPANPLAACLTEQLGPIADTVDQQIQESFIDQNGGLFQTIMGNSRVRYQMLAELGKLARRAAEQLASRPEVMQAAFASIEDLSGSGSAANMAPQQLPRTLQHGGVFRGLTVAPDQISGAQLAAAWGKAHATEASLLPGIGHDVVLICEGWELPLVQVAIDMIHRRRDYADFAMRVLTRNDVSWTPLTAPAIGRPAASAFANAFPEAMPTRTQVL